MSTNNRHARVQVDLAVRRAFRSLGRDSLKRDMFLRLLNVARERADFLKIAAGRGVRWENTLLLIRGLRNLAARRADFRRGPSGWSGEGMSPYRAFASLADHLLGEYSTPLHLALVWLDRAGTVRVRQRQDWHIALSRGARFRDLKPPLRMTRRMEHEFLKAPHHYSPEEAMRFAQVLGLGGDYELARAVLTTRLGYDLEHDGFWRTVIQFFVNWREKGLRLDQVGSIVDCLQGLRFTRTPVDTNRGRECREPSRPDLEMKGRNLRSVMEMVEEWHDELTRSDPRNGRRWMPSRFRDFQFLEYRDIRRRDERAPERTAITWKLSELLSSGELFREGRSMRHCVSMYDTACINGRSSIWSLTREEGGVMRRRLTIEVDPRTGRIRQVKGPGNARPDAAGYAIVQRWMNREGLVNA